MISPDKLEHGVLVNPTIEKFNTLLAQHSKDYSHFISLQTKNLRKIFCNIYPLYNAESTLVFNYYAARRNIDDPYSEYFAKEKLVMDLEALHFQSHLTQTMLTYLRSYEYIPPRNTQVIIVPHNIILDEVQSMFQASKILFI